MFAQTFVFVLVLFVISAVSGLVASRFVERHEVPQFALQMGLLPPGLFVLVATFFFEFEMNWMFQLAGAASTGLGLVGFSTLIYSTRLTGLQPRVTPIDLSPKGSDSDF